MKNIILCIVVCYLLSIVVDINAQQISPLNSKSQIVYSENLEALTPVNYTIGLTGQYQTIQAAFNALVISGVNAPTNLVILQDYNSSLENLPIIVKAIPGVSESNVVLLKLNSSVKNIFLKSSGSVLIFENASYVNIHGASFLTTMQERLQFTNINSDGKSIIFKSNNRNIGLYYCNIYSAKSNINGNGMISFEGDNNKNITIEGCLFKDIDSNNTVHSTGSICIKSTSPGLSSLLIQKNWFADFGMAAIYLDNINSNSIIKGNEFYNDSSWSFPIRYGIFARKTDYAHIYDNKFYKLKNNASLTGNFTAIKLLGNDSGTVVMGKNNYIYNNFISLNENTNVHLKAIDCEGDWGSTIFHNSILIKGTTGSFSSTNIETKNSNLISIRDNILVNQRISNSVIQENISVINSTLQSLEYNDYYNNDTWRMVGRFNDSIYRSITDWRNKIKKDFYSVVYLPVFTSEIDLHLSGSSVSNMKLRCVPISFIYKYDIDGENRYEFSAYMGADELRWSQLPVQITTFTVNEKQGKIQLLWETKTETNNLGFEIERSQDSEKWGKIAFVQGNNTTTNPIKYEFNDLPDKEGKYYYRLKQIDISGSFEYSSIVDIDFNNIIEFRLEQNFPNPFNPTTIFKYSLDKDEFIQLKIYNAMGEEVKTIVYGIVEKGKHEIFFNGSDLSSGVYFYCLGNGRSTEIKKMILLK